MDQGFRPRHIRFFLLSGPYREKLDMRMSRLEECAGYLDRIRRVAEVLLSHTKNSSGSRGKGLAGDMVRAFEERMNDNLDCAGAFDAVAEQLVRAASGDRGKGMEPGERELLREALDKVDSVLRILD